jgi:hypothetical protein
MDAHLSGVFTAVNNEGSPKYYLGPRLPEKSFLRTFFLKRRYSPYRAKPILNKVMMPNIDWILACASMTIEVLDFRFHENDKL